MGFLSLILTFLGNFLGGPFIKGALDAYKAKLANENSITTAKEQLAQDQIALEVREAELKTQYEIATAGSWWLPDHLMGYAVAVYFAKLLIYDKVLGWGVTDPLAGWAAFTANLIVTYYFAKTGVENVLRIWKMK
jgi:hypothetical protein